VPPGSDEATVRSLAASDPRITINDVGSVGLDVGAFKVWAGNRIMEPDALLDAPLSERLGTTADGLQVRLPDVESGTADTVVVVPAAGSQRPVIDLPAEIGPSLSLATALMSTDHPTVERPEPDWPWSDERLSITIGLGVAAAIAVLLGLRWLVRRYLAAR
jgi:hypothetical protein